MWKFIQRINNKYNLAIAGYPELYQWSIDNVAEFWSEAWHFVSIVASKEAEQVCFYYLPRISSPYTNRHP